MFAIENLTVVRGSAITALNISCTLKSGSVLLLKGPNGSGKTSFLRALAGLLKPQTGHFTIPPFHWLSALPIPPSRETPRDYLDFHNALNSGKTANDPFNIANLLDTPFNRLSTGQRQRVKLTRLLQADRKLWLLDEPSDGLDADATKTLLDLIATHLDKGGMAVIATHQPQLWPHAETLNFGETSA